MKQYAKILLSVFLILSSFNSEAQEKEEEKDKFVDHYFGVQINELIRQILNLNAEQSPVHPYFLNYGVNLHESGWGINTGFGYSYNVFRDGDAVNNSETKITDWAFRIGPDKKFFFGKRFVLGLGLDFFTEESNNHSTVTFTSVQNQFAETIVETNVKSRGIGPRLSLSYRITDHIMAGTELSYYYSLIKTEFNSQERTSFAANENFNSTNEEFDERKIVFNAPVILFLILTF